MKKLKPLDFTVYRNDNKTMILYKGTVVFYGTANLGPDDIELLAIKLTRAIAQQKGTVREL